MATSIRPAPEAKRRFNLLATRTGRSKAFYLRELMERGPEDMEDYYLAGGVLERVREGTEKVYSTSEVRGVLGLDNCGLSHAGCAIRVVMDLNRPRSR